MSTLRARCTRAVFALAVVLPLTANAQVTPAPSPATPPTNGGVAGAGTSVFAVPPVPKAPSATDQARARTESDKASRLARMHLNEGAAEGFLKAYGLAGRVSDLLGAADALHDTVYLDESLAAYRAALTNHDKQLSRPDKTRIPKQIEDIEAKSGVLTIEGEAAASITIDARPIGALPLGKPVRIAAGKHAVSATKPGLEPFDTIVEIAGRASLSVVAKLEPVATKGHLVVKEKAGGELHVFVDDRDVGPAPFAGDVEAGPHKVSGKGPDLEAKAEEVRVPLKKEITVVLEGRSLSAAIVVQPTPANAEVRIDGKLTGQGAWKGRLPPGSHEVVVSAKGFRSETRKFDVAAGLGTQLDVVLAAEAPHEDGDAKFVGVYGGVGLVGTLRTGAPLTSTTCAAGATCSQDSNAIGGGLLGHVGYSFGYFGINVVAQGSVDQGVGHRKVTAPSYDEKLGVLSYGGFGGLGIRGMTHGDVVRFSAGIAGGVSVRSYVMQRTVSGTLTDSSDANASSTAPGLLFDLSMSLGATPGTRFVIGGVMRADFQGDVTTDPLPKSVSQTTGTGSQQVTFAGVPLASGTAIFVGPMLGLQFGH